MSCDETAFLVRGHPVAVGSYVYSPADVILPVKTILSLNDEEIVSAVRDAVARAIALRDEEDAARSERCRTGPVTRSYSGPPLQVYLLKNDAGQYKIGVSRNARNRARQLSGSGPLAIEIVAVGESDHAWEKEAELHLRFAYKRIRGEWFSLNDDDVAAVVSELQAAT